MLSKRVVIFSGGNLDPGDLGLLRPDDYIIGADHGALFLVRHGIRPDISLGDFDSVPAETLDEITAASGRVIACDAVDKDLTDSELALDMALEREPEEILMLGVTGTRLDQTLASVQMLKRALERQVPCFIKDRTNYIMLTGSQAVVRDLGYTYVSLLPLTPEVTGITLEGFQYPLHDATLRLGQSLAVSNRLLGESGTVSIRSGLLLIIQSKD